MLYIVRNEWPGLGLPAHLPNEHNRPLCGAAIDASGWRMVDAQPARVTFVCRRCLSRQTRAAKERAAAAARSVVPA